MSKSIFYITAFSLLAISCAKEGFEPIAINPAVDPGRLTVITGNDLNGGIVPLNETFTLSGKAENVSYTYRVYAEAPLVNTVATSATSVASAGQFVFVSWHTEGQAYGGAVSVYQYSGTEYYYIARVDFDDTDWHDLAVSAVGSDYHIYLAGQRNPDSSSYLLNNHKGAVAGHVIFNKNAAPALKIDDYKELPLPSFGANAVVLVGNNAFVCSGNGTGASLPAGGVFRINSTFDFVDIANNGTTMNDVEHIATDGSNIYALNRASATTVNLQSAVSSTLAFSAGSNVIIQKIDNERNALAVNAIGANTYLSALGKSGLYGSNSMNLSPVKSLGSAALGIVYHDDATINEDLIYVAAGGGGVHVLASADYAAPRALVAEYDLIGKFIAPTTAPFNANFEAKDVSIYLDDKIAIASGDGGVFFVDKN